MAKQPKYSMIQVAKYLAKAPATVNAYITDLEKQISNLAKIGLALSKEKDMNVLLENILLEAKTIVLRR